MGWHRGCSVGPDHARCWCFSCEPRGRPHSSSDTPEPIADTKVPVVSEPDQVATGSAVEGSLNGVSLLLPKQLPDGMELKSASVSPVGCCSESMAFLDSYFVTYITRDGQQMLAVRSVRVVGTPTQTTLVSRSDGNTSVHGFPARMSRYGLARQLTWDEDGEEFNVYAPTELTEEQVTAFADSIVPDKTTADFTSSPPSGYAKRYAGKSIVSPAWMLTLNFESDKAQVSVDVQQLSEAFRAARELSEKFGAPGFKRVKIGEADGLAFTATETVALTWNLAVDEGVNVQTDGLSEESALAFARSLQPVDEATFRATVGSKLSIESGSLFPLPGGPPSGTFVTPAK